MKVFVTGGTGFIGQALIKRLIADGWQVIALARSRKKIKAISLKKARWVFGDIREDDWYQHVVGCDIFIHLVGVHGHKRMSYSERVTIELGGIQSAVATAKQAGVIHFVYVGTAYDQMATEYAKAKALARQWLEEQIKQGFPATIVRPVMIYGPGDEVNLHRLFKAVKSRRFVFIGDGKNIWQWLYIDDLITGLILVLRNRKKVLGKVLTLTGEQSITLRKLISLIAKEKRVSVPKIYLPRIPMLFLGKFFSLVGRLGVKMPFTEDTVVTMTSKERYYTSEALKKLGFRAGIRLEEGVARTVDWYQKKTNFS